MTVAMTVAIAVARLGIIRYTVAMSVARLRRRRSCRVGRSRLKGSAQRSSTQPGLGLGLGSGLGLGPGLGLEHAHDQRAVAAVPAHRPEQLVTTWLVVSK